MPDMLIRNVAPETHAVLKRRAASGGMSVQAYVLRLLDQHAERLTMQEWLAEVAGHRKLHGWVGADAVREAREELP